MEVYISIYSSFFNFYKKIFPGEKSPDVYSIAALSCCEVFCFFSLAHLFFPTFSFTTLRGLIMYVIFLLINYLLFFRWKKLTINQNQKIKQTSPVISIMIVIGSIALYIFSTQLLD